MSESTAANILVAEDNIDMANLIAGLLTTEGYSVTIADNGDDALRLIREDKPDLIILDVIMPAQSGVERAGLEVCRQARTFSNTPIIMLSALGSDEDQVAGLDAGADDYVPKLTNPGSFGVLLRKINRLLQPYDVQNSLSCGNVEINTTSLSVLIDGRKVPFPQLQLKTLVFLAENRGRTVSKDELSGHLHNTPYDGSSKALNIGIGRLRKTLAENSATIEIITETGKGYRLI